VKRLDVPLDHVQHRLAVSLELGKRSQRGGQLGGAPVGDAGQERGDRRGPTPALRGVVWDPERQQERGQVGVADPDLPQPVGVLLDLLARVAGAVDDRILCDDQQLDRGGEAVDVELAPLEELQKVECGQIARRVPDVQELAAGVGCGDGASVGAGMPAGDLVGELQPGVAAACDRFRAGDTAAGGRGESRPGRRRPRLAAPTRRR
jgi:hypothetical protein